MAEKQQKIRNKIFITLFIISICITLFSLYKYSQESQRISNSKESDEKLLFYAAKSHINKLLSSLLYDFERQQFRLEEKHKIALKYFQSHPTNTNLTELHKILNKDNSEKLYDIYLTNENFVITNSTLKSDIGFDLSFAKDTFLEHHKQNIIGVSGPIYEEITKNFFSYSDSFLQDKTSVLQISYRYKKQHDILNQFNQFLLENKSIKSINAYMKYKDHMIFDFPLLKFREYKPSVDEYKEINIKANELINAHKDYSTKALSIENDQYTQISIYEELKGHQEVGVVLLNMLLDQSIYDNKHHDSKLFIIGFFLFSILLLLVIYILFDKIILKPIDTMAAHIKNKSLITKQCLLAKNDEIGTLVQNYNQMFDQIQQDIDLKNKLIHKQDIFVKNAIHEISTPLNVMLLNSELRDREFGKDSYSLNIASSIKTIENTFEDLTYMMKGTQNQELSKVDLNTLIQSRIVNFNIIASSENKKIIFNNKSKSIIIPNIYELDIIRLIDNNISNAIKYSQPNTTITIHLENKNSQIVLSFHNFGLVIKDTKNIFNRYFREDSTKGGYGIGLHIVNHITKKYSMEINVTSSTKDGTKFSYTIPMSHKDIS